MSKLLKLRADKAPRTGLDAPADVERARRTSGNTNRYNNYDLPVEPCGVAYPD